MGDDLIDIAMSYIEDESMNTIWRPVQQSIGRLADTIFNSIYSLGNNLTSISYQPPTEEEREAYRQFVKAERKRQEKEENYKQFQEFTRILERTYYN